MAAFVESSERQHNLPAMPKLQRQAAHEMAQAFALTTQSFGQEPNRHIRLFKVLILTLCPLAVFYDVRTASDLQTLVLVTGFSKYTAHAMVLYSSPYCHHQEMLRFLSA